jgi:hypothetical protein
LVSADVGTPRNLSGSAWTCLRQLLQQRKINFPPRETFKGPPIEPRVSPLTGQVFWAAIAYASAEVARPTKIVATGGGVNGTSKVAVNSAGSGRPETWSATLTPETGNVLVSTLAPSEIGV